MGRLILLALLASLVTCCVLWLLVHATLLVIGLLEAALALGAFIVLRVSAQLGSGGPLLVGGIIAMALWQTPDLRAKLRARLDQARLRRKMTAGFRRCCIVGYYGDAPKITQIGRVPLGVGVECGGVTVHHERQVRGGLCGRARVRALGERNIEAHKAVSRVRHVAIRTGGPRHPSHRHVEVRPP